MRRPCSHAPPVTDRLCRALTGPGASPGHRSADKRCPQAGFSIPELTIYVALMAVIGIPLSLVNLSATRASAEGVMLSKLQERGRSQLFRIVGEYQVSLAGTTTIAPDGKSVSFTSNGGFDGASAATGDVISYEIRLDAGEIANNADDNGNGLIDEAILVRVNQTAGTQVVLSNSLSYQDSSFVQNGSGITVTLATFGFNFSTSSVDEVRLNASVWPFN